MGTWATTGCVLLQKTGCNDKSNKVSGLRGRTATIFHVAKLTHLKGAGTLFVNGDDFSCNLQHTHPHTLTHCVWKYALETLFFKIQKDPSTFSPQIGFHYKQKCRQQVQLFLQTSRCWAVAGPWVGSPQAADRDCQGAPRPSEGHPWLPSPGGNQEAVTRGRWHRSPGTGAFETLNLKSPSAGE